LKGIYEFFKFNQCYYNILKIKNISIIIINLRFCKIIFFQKLWKISVFSPKFSTSKNLSSPPLQIPKQSLNELEVVYPYQRKIFFLHLYSYNQISFSFQKHQSTSFNMWSSSHSFQKRIIFVITGKLLSIHQGVMQVSTIGFFLTISYHFHFNNIKLLYDFHLLRSIIESYWC